MAIEWERPKDPSEIVDYGHDWSAELGGDTIATSVWTAIAAAGTEIVSSSLADAVSRVFLSGGTDGETALLLNTITTNGGRTLDEAFRLSIVDKSTVAAEPTESERLKADRAAVIAARQTFLTEGAVKEVSRAGRRLVKDNPSLADFDSAIRALDRDIAKAEAVEAGRPARSAIRFVWGD